MSYAFTVYDASTGRPLRSLEVFREEEIALNTHEGEASIEGEWSASSHFIRDGAPVAIPDNPYDFGRFDYASGHWIDESSSQLDAAKLDAKSEINRAAADMRSAFLTSSQQMVYAMKREEAAAFVADEDPDPSQYPLISAEVGITGQTAFEVAQVFLNLNALSVETLAGIEARRLAALAAVAEAGTAAEIAAAVASMK